MVKKYFFLITVIFFVLIFVKVHLYGREVSQVYITVNHELRVVLFPNEHRLNVIDSITVPENADPNLTFFLHKGLHPSSSTPGVRIIREIEEFKDDLTESYTVKLPKGTHAFTLEYGGEIFHPLIAVGKEYARGFRQTAGMISQEGVYLAGSSFWYPRFQGGMVTFTFTVELPAHWEAISQGERTIHKQEKDKTSVKWQSQEPQDEIFLIAGRFTEYSKPAGKVLALVFLRTPDDDLAAKYLDATVRYIGMYESLIGRYAYKKFALVENFWETGFGMPSFTLLGPKVIRFPFIINSSYPHEILHNWWGNGVFPDYEKGNWSEGLTAYLSDHLMKEHQGNSAEHRQATLQKYADYVSSGRDFPLAQFRIRHSSPSEAIGYGKALMFFHMLRLELGDRKFVHGLQDFYRENIFRFASFDDLRNSFEKVSGKTLDTFFEQWIMRQGAPEIKLLRAESRWIDDHYVLNLSLEQSHLDKAYRLRIPVAITLDGQQRAYQTQIVMENKRIELSLDVPSRPLRVDIDPEFDIFRRLDRQEIPTAISQVFGAQKMLILLPSSAQKKLSDAYGDLAKIMSQSGSDEVEIKYDNEIKKIPADRSVVILGWENLYSKDVISACAEYEVTYDRKTLRIEKSKVLPDNHSIVLTARNPQNEDFALLLIVSGIPEALSGLGRKLPHYHKYSYLVFEGTEPSNILKGRWKVSDSPLTAFIPDESGIIHKTAMGKLSPREPLAKLSPVFSSENMEETVRFLSSTELKGRGIGTEELDRAAEYIALRFKEAGLYPLSDHEGTYYQIWEDPEYKLKMNNVIGFIAGKRNDFSDQSVVVAAHYDHLGTGWPDVREENKGKIHPGADDNASGVAILLELARVLGKELKPYRPVIFAAFSGEELNKKGSRYYITQSRQFPVEKCIAMLNLDTVGRLGKKKLLVLGSESAKEWAHIFRGISFVTGIEIEMVSEEIDSSDHISFHNAGIPTVQLFTGPHIDYHRPTDTAEKIDIEGLIKVASFVKEFIEYLSKREEPLTFSKKYDSVTETQLSKARKTSLGIIPDFAYKGDGCRLSGVVPDSPAQICGLQEGDVIASINSVPVTNLKTLSDILKSLNPGDHVTIKFIRNEKEMKVEAEIKSR